MSESSVTPIPVFNHVAMSLPADLLGQLGRTEILRFYGKVFGWTEMPTMTEDRKRMVLRVHSNEQFVFLVADEDPMSCPPGDHFGMSVSTLDDLNRCLEAAREFQEQDARVEIIESKLEDYTVLKLHSFYVRYQLPLMIEIQCYEWAEGFGRDSLPEV